MPTPQQLIAYYRACFEADNRVPQVTNFFGKKVELPYVLPDSDLISGRLEYVVIKEEWGQEADKTLQLYSKEKQLYLAAFFVFGYAEILGKRRKIIAPLLLYPASLEQVDEQYRVSLDSLQPILNPAILLPLEAVNTATAPLDRLTEVVTGKYLGFGEGFLLRETLDACFSNLETSALENYPEVLEAADFERLRKSRKQAQSPQQAQLVSALALGIMERGKSGRGILNELEEMQTVPLSDPLRRLFGEAVAAPKARTQEAISPKPLNAAQERLVKTNYQHLLSLVIGPPGTGKSFTIAALAIDAICRGQSVLIAANTPTAVSVIAKKLRHDFDYDPHAIETTNKYWKQEAKQFLEQLLQGMGIEFVHTHRRHVLEDRVVGHIRSIDQQAAIFQKRLEYEGRWTDWLLDDQPGFLRRWRLRRRISRSLRIAPIWRLTGDYLKLLHRKNKQLKEYLQVNRQYFLHLTLKKNRSTIKQFLSALRARTGSLKAERFAQVDFNVLLQALPIWLVTPATVSEILPLNREQFDLVIFDEATQCNVAAALPLLQRAKRAVVVGDPKQLRHVSFLSRQRQQQLLEQEGIPKDQIDDYDYRKLSLIDFVDNRLSDQEQVHFLREHYRSHPRLIAFSNRHFYGDSLHLMTDRPGDAPVNPMTLVYTPGQREQKGHNPLEAASVLSALQDLIAEDAHLPDDQCRTMGVISPFRQQSDHLRLLIEEHLSLEDITRHHILVGTPYHFQGEERDVILLSFALDDASHPSAFRYLDQADVFNVSITRARSTQQVFLSFDPQKRPTDSLLRQYLLDANRNTTQPPFSQATIKEDQFAKEVLDFLHTLSPDRILTQHLVSGMMVDVVLIHSNRTFFIDLIGFPGELEDALPLERIKMFDRMQYAVFPLSYWWWSVDRKRCEEALKDLLEQ